MPRPSKRRRISSSSIDDDGSLDDFIVDSDSDDIDASSSGSSSKISHHVGSDERASVPVGWNRRSKSRASKAMDSDDDDDSEGDEAIKAKNKKSKYRIHVPTSHGLPPETFEYATQIPDAAGAPDSSPYRIRGAVWKLPKKTVAASKTVQKIRPAPIRPSTEHGNSNSEIKAKPKSINSVTPLNRSVDKTSNLPQPVLTGGSFNQGQEFDFTSELADLPSDAFSSPEPTGPPNHTTHTASLPFSVPTMSLTQSHGASVQPRLHQTTLFGGRANVAEPPASQVNRVHNYRVDRVPEEESHHKFEAQALQSWIYPMNLGAIRDYQYSIVSKGLFNNTLVALPTGLGKTFIAATIMLNYYRWTKDAQIVFMAPTKPLVSQQVDACFNIVGIPRSATTLLTGEIPPALRAEEWNEKRVFFMTPQTLENDLRSGYADPKRIVLLVVDEAHRATGNYAYVKVVKLLRTFNKSFRVLALTATPGSDVEAVQEVIDGLEISKIEIRTEDSIDIQQYVHKRDIEQIELEPSDEMLMIQELLSKTLQPLVDQLCGQNAYYNKDPLSLTPFGLMKASRQWQADAGRRASPGLKGMMMGLFSVLASFAHGIKLLNMHGIGPFFQTAKDFRADIEGKGSKGSKYRKQINESPHFKKLMDRIQMWLNRDDFVGHPKLSYLCDIVLNHFLDAGDGRLAENAPPSTTRVIVFSEFRDSAEEIVRVLQRHRPLVRPSVFVGQANSKRTDGMSQKTQVETIRKFQTGTFNVLVATSIGEEGLDIGQVDLIVCYDASASPIRMLQRMGRTGRKRAGKIVLLLMKGKEKESFAKARDNYEQMQRLICEGSRFNFRHELSARIIPRDSKPEVEKKHIEIPLENTQNNSLPEPKRRPIKNKKRPAKKFHMPDGAEAGFRKASRLVNDGQDSDSDVSTNTRVLRAKALRISFELEPEQTASNPTLESVLLDPADEQELERRYQSVQGDDLQEVTLPEMTSHPLLQRSLRPTKLVCHGQYTRNLVAMLNNVRNITEATTRRWQQLYDEHQDISVPELVNSSQETVQPMIDVGRTSKTFFKDNQPRRQVTRNSDRESEDFDLDGDLDDFVVGDGDTEIIYDREPDILSDRSPSPLEMGTTKTKPFFEPSNFPGTQDTNEDDLPDVGELLGGKPTDQAQSPEKQNDGLDAGLQTGERRKRRRIIEDDSDEF